MQEIEALIDTRVTELEKAVGELKGKVARAGAKASLAVKIGMGAVARPRQNALRARPMAHTCG